jgi:hypothetical protein
MGTAIFKALLFKLFTDAKKEKKESIVHFFGKKTFLVKT